MMKKAMIVAALAASVLAAACGGGDGDDGDEATATRSSGASTVSAGSTPRGSITETSGTPTSGTPAAGATQGSGAAPTTAPGGPGGEAWTLEQAQALLASVLLSPDDLPSRWKIQSDTTTTNEQLATTDPRSAATVEECGRLLGRTVVNQAVDEDLVVRYIGGETVSFFSTAQVYATSEGAANCAAQAAQRFAEPGELARAFGSIFIDPAAVVVTQVNYPMIADGTFAATLAGQISAAGQIVDMTILIVAFRRENVSAVVGSAAAGAPTTTELEPFVNMVLERITEAQGG